MSEERLSFTHWLDAKRNWFYLTMRREETLWLLMGVNLTLNDLTSRGRRRRLYTKGLVDPSTNPVLLFIRGVYQTNRGLVRHKLLPHAASTFDKRTVTMPSSWFSEFLNIVEVIHSSHKDSLDFCELGTLRCRYWCWINFLMETWEMEFPDYYESRTRREKMLQVNEISHLSASFPGLGNSAKGRTWT